MLASLALLAIVPFSPPSPRPHPPIAIAIATRDAGDLKTVLRRRFAAADARKTGLFHDDVTADVAPLFPVGQPFRETQRIVQAQGLGELKKFQGEPHDGTTMFVARFHLETEMFSDIYVVLDFDFDGTSEQDMRLKRMKAFLRASNM